MKYIIEKHTSSRLVMKLDTNIGENSDMEEGARDVFLYCNKPVSCLTVGTSSPFLYRGDTHWARMFPIFMMPISSTTPRYLSELLDLKLVFRITREVDPFEGS
jgi:hypothetical protein